MALKKAESRVYAAGMAIQSGLEARQGVLLRQLCESTGYSLPTVHKAVRGLETKKMAGWPVGDKNKRKGALRFWQSRKRSK